MTTEVVMPQMGESLSEGTITKWLKHLGDKVERDEPLFEITTDKVDTEVPAPDSGVLEEVLVGEGETVAVGTVLAIITGGGAAKAPDKASEKATAPPSSSGGGHFSSAHEPKTFERGRQARPPATVPRGETSGEKRHVFSPAVVSTAARHGLPLEELSRIPGTGKGGRITRKDVESYAEQPRQPTETFPAASRGTALPAAATTSNLPAPPPQYLYRPEAGDKLVPMSGMRKQIAEHMVWSQQISAQVTSFSECNMHRIVKYLEANKEAFEAREGVPLTYLPFVADATVRALREFPIFNASVVGDQIALKNHIHLGIAVAIEEGLIVPVVHRADEMNFIGLARSIHDAAEKTRARQLGVSDVQGATFTITNPGMFGGLTGTPMISQPQVAILGLGAVQKKPVVVEDAIAIRPIMVLALTFDHRVIDGVTGFQFIERVRANLEQFELS